MAKYSSPSDYTSIAPNYSNGEGYYTNVDLVTDYFKYLLLVVQLIQQKHRLVNILKEQKIILIIKLELLIGRLHILMNTTIFF